MTDYLDVVLNNDSLIVTAAPDRVVLNMDTGATGQRGSRWFTGSGLPSELTVPHYDELLLYDLYLDSDTGFVYQYILLPSNFADWVKVDEIGANATVSGDNDLYYTEAETDALLASKADSGHDHNGVYDPAGTAASLIDTITPELHSHSNKSALDQVSGVNTGDQDLSGYATTASLATVATTGAYADLTGKPTVPDSPDDIGAAAATHNHDDRYYTETEADSRFVRTVNGTGPDGSGNVVVSGGGGGQLALASLASLGVVTSEFPGWHTLPFMSPDGGIQHNYCYFTPYFLHDVKITEIVFNTLNPVLNVRLGLAIDSSGGLRPDTWIWQASAPITPSSGRTNVVVPAHPFTPGQIVWAALQVEDRTGGEVSRLLCLPGGASSFWENDSNAIAGWVQGQFSYRPGLWRCPSASGALPDLGAVSLLSSIQTYRGGVKVVAV